MGEDAVDVGVWCVVAFHLRLWRAVILEIRLRFCIRIECVRY